MKITYFGTFLLSVLLVCPGCFVDVHLENQLAGELGKFVIISRSETTSAANKIPYVEFEVNFSEDIKRNTLEAGDFENINAGTPVVWDLEETAESKKFLLKGYVHGEVGELNPRLRENSFEWNDGVINEIAYSGDVAQVSATYDSNKVALGYVHGCRVDSLGDVYCWGENYSGAAGPIPAGFNVFRPQRITTSSITGSKKFLDISATEESITIGRTADRKIYQWGSDFSGAGFPASQADVPVELDLSALDAGEFPISHDVGSWNTNLCITTNLGRVLCSGRNVYGEIGDGTNTDAASPTLIKVDHISPSPYFVQANIGDGVACALTREGKAYCWGRFGNVTDDVTAAPSNIPVAVNTSNLLPEERFTSLHVGAGKTVCGLTTKGRILCWGENDGGEMGNGTTNISYNPTPMDLSGLPSDEHPVLVQSHYYRSCFTTNKYNLYCVGSNWDGSLGVGNETDSLTPMKVDFSEYGAQQIVAMNGHEETMCAITANDETFCWGGSYYGLIGTFDNGALNEINTSDLAFGVYFTQVSESYDHACAIDNFKKLYCWGGNAKGALGTGDKIHREKPVLVNTTTIAGSTNFISVVVGGGMTCAVAEDNEAYCWGSGFLGNGPAGQSDLPVQVSKTNLPGGVGFKKIAVSSSGPGTFMALGTDNQLYCWGSPFSYFCNSGSNEEIPILKSSSAFLDIDAIGSQIVAIQNDFSIQYSGVFPEPSNGYVNSSLQTASSSFAHSGTLTSIQAGGCVLDSAGALGCWGAGGVASSTISNFSLSSLSGSQIVSQHRADSNTWFLGCAIMADSKVACWGNAKEGFNGVSGGVIGPTYVDTSSVVGGFTPTTLEVRSNVLIATQQGKLYCMGSCNFGVPQYKPKKILSPAQ